MLSHVFPTYWYSAPVWVAEHCDDCICVCLYVCLRAYLWNWHSFFTRRMPYLPPNQQRQSTEGNFADRKCYNLIFSPCGGNYASYLFYWTVLDTGLLSQIMWCKFPPPHLTFFTVEHSNLGKKVSIRFYSILATASIFSIRFDNQINLPLVHWYSNSKLGVIFIVCIA